MSVSSWTQTLEPVQCNQYISCKLLSLHDLQAQEDKILELINENENLRQTLNKFKRENLLLKQELDSIAQPPFEEYTPEVWAEDTFPESIKEADTDEELGEECKSVVFFKRASLDDVPLDTSGYKTQEVKEKKKQKLKSKTVKDLQTPLNEECIPNTKMQTRSIEEAKTPRVELHQKLFKINSPRDEVPSPGPTKKQPNSARIMSYMQNKPEKPQKPKTPRTIDNLSKSVLEHRKYMTKLAEKKSYKVIKRKKNLEGSIDGKSYAVKVVKPMTQSLDYSADSITDRATAQNTSFDVSARKNLVTKLLLPQPMSKPSKYNEEYE